MEIKNIPLDRFDLENIKCSIQKWHNILRSIHPSALQKTQNIPLELWLGIPFKTLHLNKKGPVWLVDIIMRIQSITFHSS